MIRGLVTLHRTGVTNMSPARGIISVRESFFVPLGFDEI